MFQTSCHVERPHRSESAKLHHLQRGLSPLLIKPWRKLPLRKLLLTTHQQRRQLLRSLLLKSL